MATTADNVDIIVPGESGLAIVSAGELANSDVVWVGQNSGTVPRTARLDQLRQYFQQGASGLKSEGMFFPRGESGVVQIIGESRPTVRPAGLVPSGVTISLVVGDRWYDPSDGSEWTWDGSRWVSPIQATTMLPIIVGGAGSMHERNPGHLCWISAQWWDQHADGLEAWLHNETAVAIVLEQVIVTYFVNVAALVGGWSYGFWIEDVSNAMTASVYYTEPNTSEAMTMAVDPNGLNRGSANVRVKRGVQSILWNPYLQPGAPWFYYHQRIRCNTVYYRRKLAINSNFVRPVLRQFNRVGNQAPSDVMLGAIIQYRWAR